MGECLLPTRIIEQQRKNLFLTEASAVAPWTLMHQRSHLKAGALASVRAPPSQSSFQQRFLNRLRTEHRPDLGA